MAGRVYEVGLRREFVACRITFKNDIALDAALTQSLHSATGARYSKLVQPALVDLHAAKQLVQPGLCERKLLGHLRFLLLNAAEFSEQGSFRFVYLDRDNFRTGKLQIPRAMAAVCKGSHRDCLHTRSDEPETPLMLSLL